MKERILKLCKRLNKFSLDEIETISEIDSSELKPIIDGLIQEERLTYCDGTYYYNKKVCRKQQTSKLPLFFEFHKKQDIEHIPNVFYTIEQIKEYVSKNKGICKQKLQKKRKEENCNIKSNSAIFTKAQNAGDKPYKTT